MKHLIPIILCIFSFYTFAADTTVKEKAQEAANDAKRAGREAVRTIKDKTCHMINGKMECAAQKVKHSAQRASDNIEDAVD